MVTWSLFTSISNDILYSIALAIHLQSNVLQTFLHLPQEVVQHKRQLYQLLLDYILSNKISSLGLYLYPENNIIYKSQNLKKKFQW